MTRFESDSGFSIMVAHSEGRFIFYTDHLAALEAVVKEKDEEIVDIQREKNKMFEEGLAIMHDQGAENILLKEQIAALIGEPKTPSQAGEGGPMTLTDFRKRLKNFFMVNFAMLRYCPVHKTITPPEKRTVQCPFCGYTAVATGIGILYCGPHKIADTWFPARVMREIEAETR